MQYYKILKKIFKKIRSLWLNLLNYFYYTAKPSFINPIAYLRQASDRKGEREFKKIDGGYDFLFIDAPQLYFPGDAMKCFDADLINLVNDKKLSNRFILLDQRIGTLRALNKLIPSLKLKYDVIKRQSTAFLKI